MANPEKELRKKTKEWHNALRAVARAEDEQTRKERQRLVDLLYYQTVELRAEVNRIKKNKQK